MSMLSEIVEILKNYDFTDFAGGKGWVDKVKSKTRPFLKKIYSILSEKVEGITGAYYYDNGEPSGKTITHFDKLFIRMKEFEGVKGKEVRVTPEVLIGLTYKYTDDILRKSICVALSINGRGELSKEIKVELDKILNLEGRLFGHDFGYTLLYLYKAWTIQDLETLDDEEAVQAIAEELKRIIEDVRSNKDKFLEINRKLLIQEENKEKGGSVTEEKMGNLIFTKPEVEALVSAINTKPFIILAGISGTGKTQLARLVAQKWIEKGNVSSAKDLFGEPKGEYYSIPETELQSGDRKRYAFMPVRPDWNEAQKVFGFYNPLTGLFYPSDALRVVLSAYREYLNAYRVEAGKEGHPPKKHFIILDEMNLARVEYYFSDILSAMENTCKVRDGKLYLGEPFPIHFLSRCVLSSKSKGTDQREVLCKAECDGCIYMPLCKGEEVKISELNQNLPEGDPIPPRIAVPPNLVVIGTVNIDETTFSFSPKVLDRAFVLEFTEVEPEKVLKEGPVRDFVSDLIKILKPVNLHFGYRVMKEMEKFFSPGEGNKDEKKEDKKATQIQVRRR